MEVLLNIHICRLIKILIIFVFFKQKTAYEMRISDWSSDVCSSDLTRKSQRVGQILPCPGCSIKLTRFRRKDTQPFFGIASKSHGKAIIRGRNDLHMLLKHRARIIALAACDLYHGKDRKSVVEGKSVLVCVDLGGGTIIKKTTMITTIVTQVS